MSCEFLDPFGCPQDLVGGGISDLAGSAFNSVVKAFAKSAGGVLHLFGKAFVAIPPVDVRSDGVRSVYAICLGVAAVIAVFLLLGQVVRTAVTHEGSALAQGLVGIGKAALAFLLTLTVAATALRASDELTDYIVTQSFGSTDALAHRLATLVVYDGQIVQMPALLLVLAVVGMVLTLVLWFELLLRNAAIAVLVATSPLAAVGQMSEATRGWWAKAATATGQLIVLKPIMALVFALGFSLTGKSDDVETLLVGMLVLLLAVVAWPAIARFFTFASVAVGGAAGLGMLIGLAADKLGSGSGGGAPSGVPPGRFSQDAEARTMAGGAGQGGGAAAGAGAAGVAGAAVAAAGKVVDAAQKAVNLASGGMDQMAGHAGMGGRPAGYAAGSPTPGRRSSPSDAGSQPAPPRPPQRDPVPDAVPEPEFYPDPEPVPTPEPEPIPDPFDEDSER